jgi:hypothetical protein
MCEEERIDSRQVKCFAHVGGTGSNTDRRGWRLARRSVAPYGAPALLSRGELHEILFCLGLPRPFVPTPELESAENAVELEKTR